MNRNKPYQYPPAVFQPGDRVKFWSSEDRDEKIYTVSAGDHCFCWLDGFPHQVSNWRLKKVSRR